MENRSTLAKDNQLSANSKEHRFSPVVSPSSTELGILIHSFFFPSDKFLPFKSARLSKKHRTLSNPLIFLGILPLASQTVFCRSAKKQAKLSYHK